MLKVDLSNYSRYNFTMSLENLIENNKKQGNHIANYEILQNVLIETINTLKLFGDSQTTEKIFTRFIDLVEFHAMNFHRPSNFYRVLGDARQHTKFINYGIESCIKLLEMVKIQNPKKDCLHGCCK